ncbi:MAG: UPF0175 family protein [Candidatus Thiothrix putei]|uniref:UPF0175 family protein n=2 Tax=Thiothrix TaxID=1030 RepID=A0AA51QYW7_9GAMM|nr:UPF0175 family protein [Thiothrix subterranea]MDQ5770228.1 UPF0175 family protein [Thiothrix subterranea]WGZ95593.1 MAG: UPF0175 family protein [Candidatus Thiothrix putei]WML86407.1 UPF0175 family protein [Thiothrix subterranea]
MDKTFNDTTLSSRPALAASLFRDGLMSLGKATQFSGLSMSAFITHLASFGIEIARPDETTAHETQDLSAWLS